MAVLTLTPEPTRTPMSPDPLVQKIGTQGDNLLQAKVVRSDDDGYDVPFDQHVPYRDTMITVRLHNILKPDTDPGTQTFLWIGIFAGRSWTSR